VSWLRANEKDLLLINCVLFSSADLRIYSYASIKYRVVSAALVGRFSLVVDGVKMKNGSSRETFEKLQLEN